MAILIDTNVLLAAAFSRDSRHSEAAQILRATSDQQRIVTAPVVSELFYMMTARLTYQHAVQAFARTRAAFQIEGITDADMTRMHEIMSKYHDAEFDYVDVSIMAVAERLNVTRICTFDRRDFQIYQPSRCSHFDLLP
jgi:predicted nucleic acid-binding protein